MTSQNAFFTREEYFQLLYGALRPEDDPSGSRLVTLPPTIWKPKPLWTGKQIVGYLTSSCPHLFLTCIIDIDGAEEYHPQEFRWA
jgi:RNA polymerase Rpb1, domain 3